MAIRAIGAVLAAGLTVTVLVACTTTTKGHSIGAAALTQASQESGAASSPSEAPSSTPIAHPCSLLTQTEAETLAGTKLDPGTESGGADEATLCQYVGPTTGPLAQVEVGVGDGAKKVLDVDRDVLEHTFTTLSGIGDEAYQEDNNVFLRKGTNWASIRLVLLNDPSDNVERMKAAAREVANRMH
jgi:Protein of unknown function (DUF3558)